LGATAAELEIVNRREVDQHKAWQVEQTEPGTVDRCRLHVPNALQASDHVQNDGQEDAHFDNVRD
ncbi:MAG: hypothetical protein ACKPKO_31785, partial [Candidatus Fonsibacter sp.]